MLYDYSILGHGLDAALINCFSRATSIHHVLITHSGCIISAQILDHVISLCRISYMPYRLVQQSTACRMGASDVLMGWNGCNDLLLAVHVVLQTC